MAARAKITRLVQPDSHLQDSRSEQAARGYLPPFRRVLETLGLAEQALQAETVTVSASALMRVLDETWAYIEVDEAWYLDRYPDVHAAILAGRTPSASAHFRAAGYREGRHPGPPPFDPDFYFDTYKDLATTFDRRDLKGLRHHYETRGYYEGRAGVAHHFQAAGRWACHLSID